MRINYAYTSHVGKVRKNNEDNFLCCGTKLDMINEGSGGIFSGCAWGSNFPILAVFDGMGGESCGEQASYLAAESLSCYQRTGASELKNAPDLFLRNACREMNRAVCAYGAENRISVMGTTAALLSFGSRGIRTCNLGDSRIYRMHDKELIRLSQDHVLGGGRFGKSPLMQFVGVPEEEMILDPALSSAEAIAGDKYLLCTDGVTDMLSDAEISAILQKNEDPETLAGMLLDASLEKGGRDNITMIVCEIAEKPGGLFHGLMDYLKNTNRGDGH